MRAESNGYSLCLNALGLDAITDHLRPETSDLTDRQVLQNLKKLRRLVNDRAGVDGVASADYVFWRVACGSAIAQADFDLEELVRCKRKGAIVEGLEQDTELVEHPVNMQRNCDYFMADKGCAGRVLMNNVQPGDRVLVISVAPTPFCATLCEGTPQPYKLKIPCLVEHDATEPDELDLGRPGIMNGGLLWPERTAAQRIRHPYTL